jgi:hypothetical protein
MVLLVAHHWWTNSGWWTVIGVSATALITLGILAINVIAHLHDRALSGTRRPVVATGMRGGWEILDIAWAMWTAQVPREWERKHVRAIAVRLLNRAKYPTDVWFLPDKARVSWFRHIDTSFGSRSLALPAETPMWVHMYVYRPSGWGDHEKAWFSFTWEHMSGERIHFRGRLTLRIPPSPNLTPTTGTTDE